MTYQQAYDKIIQAYFKDEIKPYDAAFCFCGTLCDNKRDWQGARGTAHKDYAGYSGDDFIRLENALLDTIEDREPYVIIESDKIPERALFLGMSAALDVLKQIHIERGEIIDEVPVFQKRELTKTV